MKDNDSDDEDRATYHHQQQQQQERENSMPPATAAAETSHHQQQQQQRRSRFIGVDWDAGSSKWRASLVVKGKQEVLGLFDKETEAAQCYDDASASQHEHSNLNFLSNGAVNPRLEELKQGANP